MTTTPPIETTEPQLQRLANRTNKKVFFKKRQGCPLSAPGIPAIDYKNVELISKFLSEGGRILSMRITGVCASHQRQIKLAVKRARKIALLVNADRHK